MDIDPEMNVVPTIPLFEFEIFVELVRKLTFFASILSSLNIGWICNV